MKKPKVSSSINGDIPERGGSAKGKRASSRKQKKEGNEADLSKTVGAVLN